MALRKQYIRVINNVRKYGANYAKNEVSLQLFNIEMEKAVKRIYLQAGLFMANRTLSGLKKNKAAIRKSYIRSENKGADLSRSPLSLTCKMVSCPDCNGTGLISTGYKQTDYELCKTCDGDKEVKIVKPLSGLPKSTSHTASSLTTEVDQNKGTINLKYQTFGYNEEWVRMILAYFQRHLLEKAVIGVSNTTRERILRILNLATTEGWSNDQIIKELSDLTEIRNRARMIVRTETVRAANYGVLLGADKYEYEVEKEWIAVNDNRTRHSHANVDGQKRETDEKFANGLLFPGDPNAPANEVCNCRCSMAMVAKRDSRGRLIPKRNLIAA